MVVGVLAAGALVGVAACERATVVRSAIDDHPEPPEELDFFHALEEKTVVSNNDALHAFFLVSDGEDHWGGYDARVREARRREWLPKSFDEPANESAETGWIARVACMLARMKGGLTMSILGPVPRYAVRELGNSQILVGKREGQSFSGLEFVDFLTRLDRMSELRKYSATSSSPSGTGGVGTVAPDAKSPRLQPPSARLE